MGKRSLEVGDRVGVSLGLDQGGQGLVVKHPENCIVVYPYSPGREPGCT